ncbi:hypothetical protein Tco_1186859 [Tanacetum coccineum]
MRCSLTISTRGIFFNCLAQGSKILRNGPANAGYIDVERKNVNQEVASDYVKDVVWAIVTAAHATQKTEVPLQSYSISSDYAIKFLNFDNIPLGDTEIISMMDVKVQHEDPSIQTSPLLTILVTVIPETSSAQATTIPPLILPFIHFQQQSTPIPTPITTEATTSTTIAADSTTLTVIHKRFLTWRMKSRHSEILITVLLFVQLSNVTDVLQQQPKPQKSDADIHKIKMEQAGEQQEPKYTIDEDAMDKGVVEKLKKRKPDDADRDEGPLAGPNQGLEKEEDMQRN